MNPITDELSDDAKAELAAIFADLRRKFEPMNVDRLRFINRTWNDPTRRFYR
jgi:cytochrome c553